MGQVIELCRSCGFDIPADADGCPTCARVSPSRAARQVAGLALPTRSVVPLRGVRARPDGPARPLGRARTARSAFSFTTAFALLTFAAASLAWLVDQPLLVLQVPGGSAEFFQDVTRLAARASVAGLLIGLAAMGLWCIRAAVRLMRQRISRRRYA